MFMALQMLMGGLMLLSFALARGDSIHWPPSAPGLIALCYLTFLSSGLAYTAYGWLTMHTTPTLISTYSYVNPADRRAARMVGAARASLRVATGRHGHHYRRRVHLDRARRQPHGPENIGGAKNSMNRMETQSVKEPLVPAPRDSEPKAAPAPILIEPAPLARRALFGFIITFIAARIVVLLIMSNRMPNLYFFMHGTHVHHLNYGIFLLAGVAAYLLFSARCDRISSWQRSAMALPWR